MNIKFLLQLLLVIQDSSRATTLRFTSAEPGRTDNALRSGVECELYFKPKIAFKCLLLLSQ